MIQRKSDWGYLQTCLVVHSIALQPLHASASSFIVILTCYRASVYSCSMVPDPHDINAHACVCVHAYYSEGSGHQTSVARDVNIMDKQFFYPHTLCSYKQEDILMMQTSVFILPHIVSVFIAIYSMIMCYN